MKWALLLPYLGLAMEIVPFTDLVSDIYLLSVVWPGTEIDAPLHIEGCGTRSLWYLAVALTVVGTLVDLVPEALLLTEIAMHPRVMSPGEKGSLKEILLLFFSDGKPIIAFAAESDVPNERLRMVQISIRRRLSAIAAGLYMHDSACGREEKRPVVWKYSGIMGMLVGGEILTTIGAILFLYVLPGWEAVFSLLMSLFALLVSTRTNMIRVQNTALHQCPAAEDDPDSGRLIEFLLPGPLALIRYLLFIPVWPMIFVYTAALWPLKRITFHTPGPSASPLWVYPQDWLRVQAPRYNFLGGSIEKAFERRTSLSVVMWLIAPFLLWTLASTLRMVTVATANLCAAYFKGNDDSTATVSFMCRRRGRSWGFYFTLQDTLTLSDWVADEDYLFHRWSARAQGVLGLGLTRVLSTLLWASLLSIVVVLSVTIFAGFYAGQEHGVCMEQELAFLYAHVSWWAIVCVGHHARHRNLFQPTRSRVEAFDQVRPGQAQAKAKYSLRDIETDTEYSTEHSTRTEATAPSPPAYVQEMEAEDSTGADATAPPPPAHVQEMGGKYSTRAQATAPSSSAYVEEAEAEYPVHPEASAPYSSSFVEEVDMEYSTHPEAPDPCSSAYVETTAVYSTAHVGQTTIYSSADVGVSAPDSFSGVDPRASYRATHVEVRTAYVPQTLNHMQSFSPGML